MKGPLKVDNPIASKVDRSRMWVIFFKIVFFVKDGKGVEIRILCFMLSRFNLYACLTRDG